MMQPFPDKKNSKLNLRIMPPKLSESPPCYGQT